MSRLQFTYLLKNKIISRDITILVYYYLGIIDNNELLIQKWNIISNASFTSLSTVCLQIISLILHKNDIPIKIQIIT